MKRIALTACALLLGSLGFAGQASAELFLYQVGDGSAALSSVGTAGSILRLNNDGTPSASPTITLPTSGTPLVTSGSATSEGFISLSTDGNYLAVAGYAVIPGTTGVANATSATVPRAVGIVNLAAGTVDASTVFTGDTSYSGGNIRSAFTTNGTDIWAGGTASSGANGGVRYTTKGATTSTQIPSSPTNFRVVNVQNDQLYGSTMSGAFRGVNTIGTGVPTTTGQTTTLLAGFDPSATAVESAYDFWFKDANTLYVADDRTNGSGGIQKWELNAGTWTQSYILAVGTGTGSGARGLAGTVDGGNVVLYATTTEASANRLISITDTGSGATYADLLTAPTNTAFRGVDFKATNVTPPNFLASDYNHDGSVNGTDLGIFTANFGTGTTNAQGDGTGDMVVDGADVLLYQQQQGSPQPPAVAAIGAVPEPASVALAAFGLVALAGLRRRGE